MVSIFHTSARKAGLPPGTPVYVGRSRVEPVRMTLIDYDATNYSCIEDPAPESCQRARESPSVTWLNVDGLHQAAKIEELGSLFNIHPLTLEDILNTHQRPKMDLFDDYLYFVVSLPTYDEQVGEISKEQVSIILTERVLLTFQEKKGDPFDGVRERIRNNKGRIRKMGQDYLAYALLDSLVDNYFVILERVGEQIEALEDELLENPETETLHRIHGLKREMILLRKSVWPLREMIGGLQRDGGPYFGEATFFYLKDVYDHTIQVIDTVETYRDIIGGMLDIYLSTMSNKMNEVMKVLTIFAALFIPQTLIAGIYGMNFNTAASPFNMPELNWLYGYPFALGLMALVGGTMLLFLKWKKWL